MMHLIEQANNKAEGSTKAAMFNNPMVMLEEFLTGITVPQNLLNMVLDSKDEHPVSGEDFWKAHNMSAAHDVHEHHSKPMDVDLSLPSKGDYRLPNYNF